MLASDYQQKAARTLIDAPDFQLTASEQDLLRGVMSLGVFVGQMQEHVKKGLLHRHGLKFAELRKLIENAELAARFLLLNVGYVEHDETEKSDDPSLMLLWNALGLQGEANELTQEVLMIDACARVLDRDRIVKELGDVAWYLAATCTKLGISLDEVFAVNIAKLEKIYPNGWDAERSKNKPTDQPTGKVPVDDLRKPGQIIQIDEPGQITFQGQSAADWREDLRTL